MKQKTFILIGLSGCGKGTQGKLLSEKLKALDSERDVLYIQCGGEFRKFIQGESITQKLSKTIYDAGGLQPEFLAIYMWVNVLVNQYTGTQNIIMDGMPRRFHETGVLHSIFDFYTMEKPYVIHLDVSEQWSVDHLMKRGRTDDNEEDIRERLKWFATDVAPAIEFYRNSNEYKFIKINGERTIEEVHADIVKAVGLA